MMGGLGGVLGPAAAMGAGGVMTGKAAKKNKKLLKYGLPLAAGVGGAYVLSKGMKKHKKHKSHGHHGHGGGSSSSSSSSSSSDSD